MHNQLARISHSFPQVPKSAKNWFEKKLSLIMKKRKKKLMKKKRKKCLNETFTHLFSKYEYEKRHMERYMKSTISYSVIKYHRPSSGTLYLANCKLAFLNEAFLFSLLSSIQKLNKVRTCCSEN